MFRLTEAPIEIRAMRDTLSNPACGGFVSFEGRVRNHHQGSEVVKLEYEAYPKLAISEGNRILAALKQKYGLSGILCVHRTGELSVGEIAVWIGAIGVHRRECFAAVSEAMSLIKESVPIWKHEWYANGDDEWVRCSHEHEEAPADQVIRHGRPPSGPHPVATIMKEDGRRRY
ncbi:MAG: molybdenum cofactor biosynthesis protein MoaE [Fibrobacteria bacterium]